MKIVFRDIETGRTLATVATREAQAVRDGMRAKANRLARVARSVEAACEHEAETLAACGLGMGGRYAE